MAIAQEHRTPEMSPGPFSTNIRESMMEEDVREKNYSPINQLKLKIPLLQISRKHISKQRSKPLPGLL